ncbi:MAG: HAD family hydrolase [Candidatus Paceibacterota bacterium]|jgi:HAD superfamily hydrolase (TIGR01509 family)
MRKEIVIFDFDGVIVNSLELGYSINKEMMPDLKYEEWAGWFEGNLYKNIRKEHANDKSQNDFHQQYSARVNNCLLVEGITETIKELSRRFDLIIISSSTSIGIRNFLEKHNLISYFKEILGADIHRSKIEKFKMVLLKYNIKPEETLIITDSVGDIKEAKNVGVKTVAVTWGIHDIKKLKNEEPDSIVKRPSEVVGSVFKVLS